MNVVLVMQAGKRVSTDWKSKAVNGEESNILRMLTKAEGYAKRYSPLDLLEEVRDYLAGDVVKAVRTWMRNESNSVTLESYVAIVVRNRVSKIVALKRNQTRGLRDDVTDPAVMMSDQVSLDDVLNRLSPLCRRVAEYAIAREIPIDAYLDGFSLSFELNIPVEGIGAVLEQLQNELEHGG